MLWIFEMRGAHTGAIEQYEICDSYRAACDNAAELMNYVGCDEADIAVVEGWTEEKPKARSMGTRESYSSFEILIGPITTLDPERSWSTFCIHWIVVSHCCIIGRE